MSRRTPSWTASTRESRWCAWSTSSVSVRVRLGQRLVPLAWRARSPAPPCLRGRNGMVRAGKPATKARTARTAQSAAVARCAVPVCTRPAGVEVPPASWPPATTLGRLEDTARRQAERSFSDGAPQRSTAAGKDLRPQVVLGPRGSSPPVCLRSPTMWRRATRPRHARRPRRAWIRPSQKEQPKARGGDKASTGPVAAQEPTTSRPAQSSTRS